MGGVEADLLAPGPDAERRVGLLDGLDDHDLGGRTHPEVLLAKARLALCRPHEAAVAETREVLASLPDSDMDDDADPRESTAASALREVCMHNLAVLHLAALEGGALPADGSAEGGGVLMCPEVGDSLQLPPDVVFGATGVALRVSAAVAYEQ